MTVGDGQIRCDSCGTELNPEAKFCKSCGRSTSAAVDSPSPGANRTHPCVVAGRGVGPTARRPNSLGWTLGRRTSEPFTKLCSFDTDVAIDIDREWRPLFQPEERKVGGCGRHSRRCDHRWNRHPSAFEAFSNECNRFLFFTHEHNWRFRYKSPRGQRQQPPRHRPRRQLLSNPPMWRHRRSISCLLRAQTTAMQSSPRQMTSRAVGTSAKTSPRSTAPPSRDNCS